MCLLKLFSDLENKELVGGGHGKSKNKDILRNNFGKKSSARSPTEDKTLRNRDNDQHLKNLWSPYAKEVSGTAKALSL